MTPDEKLREIIEKYSSCGRNYEHRCIEAERVARAFAKWVLKESFKIADDLMVNFRNHSAGAISRFVWEDAIKRYEDSKRALVAKLDGGD